MISAARTQALPVKTLPSATELRWPDRDVGDLLDYSFDLTNFLADCGDTIAGAPALISSPADMTIGAPTVAGNVVTWMLGGGTLTSPITDYALIATVVTAAGRTIERTIWMRTGKLSVNTSYPTDVVVIQGPEGPSGTGFTINGTFARQLDTTSFAIADGTLTLANPPLIADEATIFNTNGTLSAAILQPDNTTILSVGGVLSVKSTPFVSLAGESSILPTDDLPLVRNGTIASITIQQLALEIGTLLAPTLTLDKIYDEPTGVAFLVTGELTNYDTIPTLTYKDGSGAAQALPAGSTVTLSNFSFTHPAMAAGSNFTVTVTDSNGVGATSNTFNVNATVASAATLSNVPATAHVGVPITGVTVALTPAGATAYATLFGPNGYEGGKIAFSGTVVPNLTPSALGNYKIQILQNTNSSSKLVSSSTIVVGP